MPVAGIGEEGQGGRRRYECCTFRGSVTALDANTGAVVWKSYSIPEEPKPRGKNKDGVQTWGPAGGGIWAAPTIDPRRAAIYVATGNGYADPPQRTTDAVIALDMNTGKIKWVNQPRRGDVWMGGCKPENPDNPNCPAKLGPDYDFSVSPLLTEALEGPRSAHRSSRSRAWRTRSIPTRRARSSGSTGRAGQRARRPVGRGRPTASRRTSASVAQTPGGMRAVNIDTGEEVWSKPAAEKLCGTGRGCNAAQGGAVTVIPGVVLSSSADGGLRAYSTENGSIVWQFDTNREFQTVNGVKAKGGAMDGPGAVVAGGMVYMNSGYVSLSAGRATSCWRSASSDRASFSTCPSRG